MATQNVPHLGVCHFVILEIVTALLIKLLRKQIYCHRKQVIISLTLTLTRTASAILVFLVNQHFFNEKELRMIK